MKLICQKIHGLFTNYENLIFTENTIMSDSIHLTSQYFLTLLCLCKKSLLEGSENNWS